MSAREYSGDFELLNPFPTLRDEWGQFHCPMPLITREWNEDDTTTKGRALCGEPLGVEWSYWCPLSSDEVVKDGASEAVATYWKVSCAHGHVLLTSHDGTDSEDAQPFDPRDLFGDV